jgi:histidine triad (HIT) family protein
MGGCIFCEVINGSVPSFKIYEDDEFLAILDRFPSALGHALIMPKTHAQDVFALNAETAKGLFPLAKRVAEALRAELGCDGINILQNNGEAAGQSVNHLHVHVIPRFYGDGTEIRWKSLKLEEAGFERLARRLSV